MIRGEPPSSIVPIASAHDVSAFDCGVLPLDEYLRKHALHNHQNRSARTFVTTRGSYVVGYYTLAAGSVSREESPERVARGLARHPVPVIILARLAVDRSERGYGLGAALLKDAVLRAFQASDSIGCRAILAHAKDESVRSFYTRYGFEPSPVQDLSVFLLVKDVRGMLAGPRL